MAERARRHPDLILVQVFEHEGCGFTYLSPEDFDLAAEHLMVPALKYANADSSNAEVRRDLAYDFLWRYFNKPQAKGYFRENVRWIAAAAAREKFAGEVRARAVPRVIAIGRKPGDGGIAIRDAQEYLEHSGFPLALIVGKPQHGGGASPLLRQSRGLRESRAGAAHAGDLVAANRLPALQPDAFGCDGYSQARIRWRHGRRVSRACVRAPRETRRARHKKVAAIPS